MQRSTDSHIQNRKSQETKRTHAARHLVRDDAQALSEHYSTIFWNTTGRKDVTKDEIKEKDVNPKPKATSNDPKLILQFLQRTYKLVEAKVQFI